MSLRSSILSYPIPAKTQQLIINAIWDTASCGGVEHLKAPYFQYYTEQCRIASHVHGSNLQAKSHQDILDIISYIQKGLTRHNLVVQLFEKRNEKASPEEVGMLQDSIHGSIDLAARLALMLDIGELRNAFSGRKRLIWNEGALQDFVYDVFPDKILLGHEAIKLGTSFTARNLNRITGFKVELTTNLADHLRFRYEDRTVSIFHHASFLRYQRK